MTIPKLNSSGLLPPGIHKANLSQIPLLFCHSEYRQSLWDSAIVQFIPTLKHSLGNALDSVESVIIGGSFLSDKELPADIELTTVLHPQTPGDLCWHVQTMWQNHFKLWKDTYRADYYPSLPGSNDFSQFFQYVGEKTALEKSLDSKDKRGVLRLNSW